MISVSGLEIIMNAQVDITLALCSLVCDHERGPKEGEQLITRREGRHTDQVLEPLRSCVPIALVFAVRLVAAGPLASPQPSHPCLADNHHYLGHVLTSGNGRKEQRNQSWYEKCTGMFCARTCAAAPHCDFAGETKRTWRPKGTLPNPVATESVAGRSINTNARNTSTRASWGTQKRISALFCLIQL